MHIQDIMTLDEQYYLETFGRRMPVAFTHGQGATLYDTEGKAYVDFVGGIAVNALGYAHPRFTAAIVDQAQKLIHTSNLYYGELQAKLAQKLMDHTCGKRVFFGNSGAEANEAAYKLARKHFYNKGEKRYKVITAFDSFHGRTLANVAATAQPKYQKPYAPLPAGFVNVPYNDAAAMEQAIDDETCAIMIETIQGEAGVIECDPSYIKKLRELTQKHGILLIFDEVQTGIGRTGKLMGYEHFGVEPDIFTLAKALGNGIPMGAVVAGPAVEHSFLVGDHGSTFGGGPLACRAGLAVLHELLEEGLIDTCDKTGQYMKRQLNQLKAKHDCIIDVRGRGLLLGAQLADHIDGKAVTWKAQEQGFILNCAGHNTLRFAPPFVVTPQQIDQMIDTLDHILASLV